MKATKTKGKIKNEWVDSSILFVDVVGFSKLGEEDQAKTYNHLWNTANSALNDYEDYIMKSAGDGLLIVAFDPSIDVLDIGKFIQRRLKKVNILLREGIDCGKVSPTLDRSDAIGDPINRCQRIMDCGDANHILISASYVEAKIGQRYPIKFCKDVGDVIVKHGRKLHIFNYDEGPDYGNPSLPQGHGIPIPGGIAIQMGCDEVQFFRDRNVSDFPYPVEKTLRQAANNGSITVIARTARSWFEKEEYRDLIRNGIAHGKLDCRFVIADPYAEISILKLNEREEFQRDLIFQLTRMHKFTSDLTESSQKLFQYLLSPTLTLDSVTYLKAKEEGRNVERIFFDLYTGTVHGALRPTIVITHTRERPTDEKCLISQLRDRIQRTVLAAGIDASRDEIRKAIKILDDKDFEPSRLNPAIRLLPRLPDAFEYMSNIQPWLGPRRDPGVPEFLIPSPLCAQIEITDICNVTGCVFCSKGSGDRVQKARSMGIDMFRQLAQSLSSMGVKNIVLSGGEPLLHPDIENIFTICNELSLNVALLTDGLLLENEQIRRKVMETVTSLRISVDGADDETYRTVRRLKANLQSPTSSIKGIIGNLQHERYLSRSEEIDKIIKLKHVGICTTICRQNVDQIDSIMKWVDSLGGVDSLVFKFAHGRLSDIWPQAGIEYVCTEKQVRQLGMRFKVRKEVGNNSEYILNYITRMGADSIAKGKPTAKVYEDENLICFMPMFVSLIDTKGDVYPCCHLYYDNSQGHPDRQNHRMGSIRNMDFQRIWRSKDYNIFRLTKVNALIDQGIVRCICPMRGECSRYWKQNYQLTSLYREYQTWSLSSRKIFREEAEGKEDFKDFWI